MVTRGNPTVVGGMPTFGQVVSQAFRQIVVAAMLNLTALLNRFWAWAFRVQKRAVLRAERERERKRIAAERLARARQLRTGQEQNGQDRLEQLRRQVARARLGGRVAHDPLDGVAAIPPTLRHSRDRLPETLEKGDLVWLLVTGGPEIGTTRIIDGIVVHRQGAMIVVRKGKTFNRVFQGRFEVLSRTKG